MANDLVIARASASVEPGSPAVSGAAEVALAGFGRRSIAFGLDTALVCGLLILLMTLLPLNGEDWYWIGFLLAYFFYLVIPLFFVVVLPLAFAASARAAGGRTPGKVLVGAAIRAAGDSGRVGFWQLFRRERSRGWKVALLFVPAVADHLAALRNPLRQTWHDRAGGTVVVCSRPRLRDLPLSVSVFAAVFFAALASTIGLLLLRLIS
jgi:uncharacterized RDD family membrane protein YckC